MELYKSLNWSRKSRRIPGHLLIKCYDFNFSDDENDEFYQKLNEIDNIHMRYCINIDNDEEIFPIDPRTKKVVENIVLDCRGSSYAIEFFTDFPFRSELRRFEHTLCNSALSKMFSSKTPENEAQDENHRSVYNALQQRRLDEKVKFQKFVTDYCNINLITRLSTMDAVYDEYITRKRKLELNRLQLSFHNGPYQLHTAIPRKPFESNEIVELKFIKNINQTGRVPEFWLPHSLKISLTLNSKKDSVKRLQVAEKPYISKDMTVREIINTHAIEFIATVKSIRHLIDGSIKNWCMRLQIKEIDGRKVLLLDKPLPPKEMTRLAKNQKAHKHALKIYTQNSHDIPEDMVIESNLNEEIEWDLCEFDKYLENIDVPIVEMESHKNFTYSQWELRNSTATVALLVRTKQDGKIIYSPEQHDLVNISSKLEYCSQFGAQVMTQEELIRDWCRHNFRSNTITKRVRIDCVSSFILSQKTISLAQIEFDLNRLYKVTPHFLLKNLWSKIEILKNFPNGDYFLIAQEKSPDIINIHVSSDKAKPNLGSINEFTIDSYINSISFDHRINELVEILDIDDMEVTSFHRQLSIMPCAFGWWFTEKNKSCKVLDFKDRFNAKRTKKAKLKEEMERNREIQRIAKKKHKRNAKRKLKSIENRKAMAQARSENSKYDDDVDPYGDYVKKPIETKKFCNDDKTNDSTVLNDSPKTLKYFKKPVPEASFFKFQQSQKKTFLFPHKKWMDESPSNSDDSSQQDESLNKSRSMLSYGEDMFSDRDDSDTAPVSTFGDLNLITRPIHSSHSETITSFDSITSPILTTNVNDSFQPSYNPSFDHNLVDIHHPISSNVTNSEQSQSLFNAYSLNDTFKFFQTPSVTELTPSSFSTPLASSPSTSFIATTNSNFTSPSQIQFPQNLTSNPEFSPHAEISNILPFQTSSYIATYGRHRRSLSTGNAPLQLQPIANSSNPLNDKLTVSPTSNTPSSPSISAMNNKKKKSVISKLRGSLRVPNQNVKYF